MTQELIKSKISVVSGFLVFSAIGILCLLGDSADAQILRQSSQENQLSSTTYTDLSTGTA